MAKGKAAKAAVETDGTTYYYLRNIRAEYLELARARATEEGRTLKWVLERALAEYGAGRWSPDAWKRPEAART